MTDTVPRAARRIPRGLATLAAGALLLAGCAGPAPEAATTPAPPSGGAATSGGETPAPGGAASPGGTNMTFRFEAAAENGCYGDTERAHRACVRAENAGGITSATAKTGLDFPEACATEPCHRMLLEVPHAPELNPGKRPFRFGAELLLRPGDRSSGSNVVEKGFFDDPRGQWKLQVDGRRGRPSCVVQGQLDGRRATARVYSSRGVADGRWHTVTCVRTASAVVIEVDGVQRGRARVATGNVVNNAPVKIGAKNLRGDNDQFHGAIRSVTFHVAE